MLVGAIPLAGAVSRLCQRTSIARQRHRDTGAPNFFQFAEGRIVAPIQRPQKTRETRETRTPPIPQIEPEVIRLVKNRGRH